jgi:eukaryotic-like serine/threonine-protein kinase
MLGSLLDGKYRVLSLLGEGGMGSVYEAVHTGTQRRVALKIISNIAKRDAEALVRFQREAAISGKIDSAHVVQVMDTGTDAASGNPYLVMELLQGDDLQRLQERLGPLDPRLAVRIAMQACVALQKAHDAGVIHRDVKPANIFLAQQDMGQMIVKVLDFGIAKFRKDPMSVAEAKLTKTGNILGSPLYMPPEQVRSTGNADARSDVFSLGVVLYESLCGVAPWAHAGSLGELILAICGQQAPHIQDRAPWISAELTEVVHTAVQVDPARRFQHMSEMFAALQRLSPDGWAIRADMVRGMSPQERGVVARRFERTQQEPPPSFRDLPPSATGLPVGRSSDRAFTESISAVSTGAGPRKRSGLDRGVRAGLAVFVGVSLIGLGGLGVWYAKQRQADRAVLTAGGSPSASAQPGASAPPPEASAAPATRSVVVHVEPASARVRVGDVEASVTDGKVVLEGALGSVHTLTLEDSGRQTSARVVISEGGAVPSTVTLASTPRPTPGVAAGPAPSSRRPTPPAVPTPTGGRRPEPHPGLPATAIQTGTDEFK